jgi:hypothetical protein
VADINVFYNVESKRKRVLKPMGPGEGFCRFVWIHLLLFVLFFSFHSVYYTEQIICVVVGEDCILVKEKVYTSLQCLLGKITRNKEKKTFLERKKELTTLLP